MNRRILLTLPLLLLLASACRGDPDDPRATLPNDDAPAEAGGVHPDSLYGARALETLRVIQVEMDVPGLPQGWDGIRLAAISDLQIGLWPENEEIARGAMQAAARQNPDIVLLLGDFVARGEVEVLTRVLEPLQGRAVMAVLGDRDVTDRPQGMPADSAERHFLAVLERSGVRVLRNTRAGYERGGDTAYIAGVDPYTVRWPDWRRAQAFAAIPEDGRNAVLLSHMPALAGHLPEGRFHAILGGHTLCGRMEVPGTPRLSWLRDEALPAADTVVFDRFFRLGERSLFVTCGTGYTFVPARYRKAPEIAIVTLRRVAAAAEEDGDVVDPLAN
jgi:uncharacterized protein